MAEADSAWVVVCRGGAIVLEKQVEVPSRHLVGRSSGCGIILDDREVSRLHAVLNLTHEGVLVRDLSSNGIWLRGGRVQNEVITTMDDIISIGPFSISVSRDHRGEGDGSGKETASELRHYLHEKLIEHLDLRRTDYSQADRSRIRGNVVKAIDRLLKAEKSRLPDGIGVDTVRQHLMDDALGLGPLEPLLRDEDTSEIMVVDPGTVYVEKNGRLERCDTCFTDQNSLRSVIERIVAPIGRRIDDSSPLVDARLPDGSRVNAVIPPLASRGPCLTIRRFSKKGMDLDDLGKKDSLEKRQAVFLERAVKAKRNIVISGGTGSGKTTLLGALSAAIPEDERIITIEDSAELRLLQPHVVSLEARPANMEGKGATTIRDLLKNALRMRPDRIIVGECRGGEALDMLQAMNTGHDGSLTTLHANSPVEAAARLETMALMSGLDLPADAIRVQIASSIHLIVQIARYSDGSRRVSAISEVAGLDEDSRVEIRDIFTFINEGMTSDGSVRGTYLATGYLPSFLDMFFSMGLVSEEDGTGFF